MCSDWQSLDSQGLILGKVSTLFLKKTVQTLYAHLKELAQCLSSSMENLKAFYQLLFLLTLEFSEPGVLEMILYLNWLQTLAVGSDSLLGVQLCNALHAIVAGVLYLISKISLTPGLNEHVSHILTKRREHAPHLLPEGLFTYEERADGTEDSVGMSMVNRSMLFTLNEEDLMKKSPEPRKGFGETQKCTKR